MAFTLRGAPPARLADAARPGRPRRFTPVQRAQVTAIACELPATRGMPLSRWSSSELACEAIEAGVVGISPSTVRCWLAADALKPWQFRSWIAPRAPDFAAKAEVVLDLYARVFDGQPLGPGDYVLCSDERPRSRPAAPARSTGVPPGTPARHSAPAFGQHPLPRAVAGVIDRAASGRDDEARR